MQNSKIINIKELSAFIHANLIPNQFYPFFQIFQGPFTHRLPLILTSKALFHRGEKAKIYIHGLKFPDLRIGDIVDQAAYGRRGRRDQRGLGLNQTGSVQSGQKPHSR